VSLPIALAVLGDPLAFTRSPELHRAGLAALGVPGSSAALPTSAARLGQRLGELERAGCRGVNLTHPLKEAVLPLLARLTPRARAARSVNTVGLDPGSWWGDTTDGEGFVDLLVALGRRPARERVVLLGAGGAARSLALALERAGVAGLVLSARRPEAAPATRWRIVPWRSQAERDALAAASVVVNATPIGPEEHPAPLAALPPRALLVDLVYGRENTRWVRDARATGREAYDGLGLLVFQARRSLAGWLGCEVPVDPLARAVGWPR
jgi:shikimate dehydrogenase